MWECSRRFFNVQASIDNSRNMFGVVLVMIDQSGSAFLRHLVPVKETGKSRSLQVSGRRQLCWFSIEDPGDHSVFGS